MIRVAVAGLGYWGPNHVRTFAALDGATVVAVCDPDREALARVRTLAPHARPVTDFDALLVDPDVDAIVLATPSRLHAEQAERALAARKHVLVEKPMALALADAERLAAVARAGDRVYMVGHLMVYNPAVSALRRLIADGTLGEVYYLYSARVNLGRLRRDENALWSFGPHEASMILHLLDAMPVAVSAMGHAYLQPGVEDVVFLHMRFGDGRLAHVQMSWLHPHKERRLILVGSKRMVEFDDVHPTEKLRIYDKGYDRPPAFADFAEYLTLRHGAMHVPPVDTSEPLAVECREFLRCIRERTRPTAGAAEGLAVVRVLDAATRSLRAGGTFVDV